GVKRGQRAIGRHFENRAVAGLGWIGRDGGTAGRSCAIKAAVLGLNQSGQRSCAIRISEVVEGREDGVRKRRRNAELDNKPDRRDSLSCSYSRSSSFSLSPLAGQPPRIAKSDWRYDQESV